MKRMSSLRRSWVFCNELSTKIASPICATERTAMIVPWHDERTRTGAFVILPADELLSANINKKRRQCELPMTTDFDAPLRTQTIITDKVYYLESMYMSCLWSLEGRNEVRHLSFQILVGSINFVISGLICTRFNREVLQNEFRYDFRKGPREISAGTNFGTIFGKVLVRFRPVRYLRYLHAFLPSIP